MSTFDPYYQWLGIPPAQQPANHYRLLGITDFEPDPTVTENAADQRTLMIRNVSNGPNAKVAQQLLNEVSAAKLVLLDPQRKAQYDEALRQSQPADRMARPASAPGPAPAAGPASAAEATLTPTTPADTDLAGLAVSGAPSSSASVARANNKRRKSSTGLYTAVGGGLLAVLVALFFILGDPEKSDDKRDTKERTASLSLSSISDRTAEVGTVFAVKAKIKTKGDFEERPKFSLEKGSPKGASIDSATGEIRWTPKRSDHGRAHAFRVRVAVGKFSIARDFVVTVAEVNDPP
jgi:hypothetical protein